MNSKQLFFESLRINHPVFEYESFDYSISDSGLEMSFRFSIGTSIQFNPTLKIPQRSFYQFGKLNKEQLDLLVFQIGMIELVSYWKCTCSPVVKIKPFGLTNEQVSFWKKLYLNGLGEFFFVNGITCDEDTFMQLHSSENKNIAKQKFLLREEVIVPVGGGKDSVVSLELLRKTLLPLTPMIINPRQATKDCISAAGYTMDDVIEVKRNIDPKLLELNEQGFLNGHTPFSAMLAFVSLLCAAASGKRHIALSNESSANEATVENSNVNHQYSKSLEFESDFRNYVHSFISEEFNYFSFLRPLNELQIAKAFSSYEHYYKVFRSCNAGSKTDSWCGKCAKCLFVYIILSPFIAPAKMQEIFGADLFNDETLLPYFHELCGKTTQKPFECVGTVEEVNYALALTIKNYYQGKDLPALLKIFNSENPNFATPANKLTDLDEEHFLNELFLSALTDKIKTDR